MKNVKKRIRSADRSEEKEEEGCTSSREWVNGFACEGKNKATS